MNSHYHETVVLPLREPPSITMQNWSIDLVRCIGCTLSAPVDPWNCITMVPSDPLLREKKHASPFA